MSIVIGNEGKDALAAFEEAGNQEGQATRNLMQAMEAGCNGEELLQLNQEMIDAHNRKMELYDALEKFRLG